MTGLGAYCYIVWGIWIRRCLNGEQDEFICVWPRLYRLPEIVRVEKPLESNGFVPNGPVPNGPVPNGPSKKKIS